MSCARAEAANKNVPVSNVTNIIDNPAESMMRLFIMTIGEFTIFYRSLNFCENVTMRDTGKVLINSLNIIYL